MDVATILTSISSAVEVTKLIKSSNLTLDKAEMNLKLADLAGALADTRLGLSEIQQQLIDKDDEIRKLKAEIAIQVEMQFESPYYWREHNGKKEGPFCQKCFDKDKIPARLLEENDCRGFWKCRVCSNTYKDSTYVKPQLQIPNQYDTFRY